MDNIDNNTPEDKTLRFGDKDHRAKGRPKGAKSKHTLAREQLLTCTDVTGKIADGSLKSPLAFLIDVYSNNDLDIKVRVTAAKEVASYLHKKQPTDSTTTVTASDQLFTIQLVPNKPKEE